MVKKQRIKNRKSEFKPSPKQVDLVIRNVQLVDIILLDCSARRILNDFELDVVDVQFKRLSSADILIKDDDLSLFGCTYHFGIRGMIKTGDNDPAEAFRIESSFRLTYELKKTEGITTEDIASFVIVNSTHHAWPFWREIVHNIMGRMGLRAVTIPVKPPIKSLDELTVTIEKPPTEKKKKSKKRP